MLAGGDNATLSRIVSFFGVTPADWLQVFPLSMIIIVNTWRGIATAMILLTAGLSTIPAEIYEAARMWFLLGGDMRMVSRGCGRL